jgi:hypothetical protein
MLDSSTMDRRQRLATVRLRPWVTRPSNPFWEKRWRWASSLVFVGLTACAEPLAPLPSNAVEFVPGFKYQVWWQEVETCSDLRGEFGRIRWYMVPGLSPFEAPGIAQPVLGYWDPNRNSIVTVEWARDKAALVRHEVLHSLLGLSNHPREYFLDRCGDLVTGPGVPLTID